MAIPVLNRVTVTLFRPSNPVIGVELCPIVRNAPEDSLIYTWYRKLYDKNMCCCVHKKEKADIYCSTCHTLRLPLQTSYFCSVDCYYKNWENHQKLHSEWLKYHGVPKIGTSYLSLGPDYEYYFEDEGDIDPERMHEEENGTSWLPVGYSKNYIPTREDYGSVLKLVTLYVNPGTESSPIDSLSTERVIEGPTPNLRRVIPVGSPSTFKVLTYNLLADSSIVGEYYNYCPKWAQNWEYRRQNLLREITAYNADIVCLQEVQDNHFFNFFGPELHQLGYSSVFESKDGKVTNREGSVKHGCATFFRQTRLIEVHHFKVRFRDYGQRYLQSWWPNQDIPELRRLLQDNIALLSILQFVGDNAVSPNSCYGLCVVNTHISVPPKFEDIKLWQVATLIHEIERIVSPELPILICGDFNILPNSEPYKLIVSGHVHNMPKDPTLVLHRTNLYHGLRLVSAYRSWNGEPQFTYFTKTSRGTLDYIFYSADKLRLKGLLELLESEDILKNTGLPSPDWSSDHIALMAEFCLMPP